MNRIFSIKKINIYLITLIIFFLNFFTPASAKENYCSDLYDYLTSSDQYINIFGKNNSESYRFGFDLESDVTLENISLWADEFVYFPYRRSLEGYLKIQSVDLDGPFANNEFLISPHDLITKIDGIDTSSITDETFDYILASEDEHTFEFFLRYPNGREDLIESLSSNFVTTTIKRGIVQDKPNIYISVVPIDLIEVNTKDSEYTLNYHQNIVMYISTHLLQEDFPVPKDYDDTDIKTCSYASATDNFFEKFKITDPILKLGNKIEDISTNVNDISISIPTKNFFYDDEIIIIDFFSDKNSKFTTSYDLRLFPFDAQSIWSSYKLHYTSDLFTTGVNLNDQKYHSWNLIENHITPGFDLLKVKYSNHTFDYNNRTSNNVYSYEIDVKRQNFYHIAKILIPIFLILILSWSSFWIKSKEIEAKLTVTIICFLTLIAYNFVIDSDLPRLDYLTWLDYYILFSYVFCGITTFAAIFDYTKITNRKKTIHFTQTIKSVGIPTFLLLNIFSYYFIKFLMFYDF